MDKPIIMICEWSKNCKFECPTKIPHELNNHPIHYGNYATGYEGDAPTTLSGAKCIPYKNKRKVEK